MTLPQDREPVELEGSQPDQSKMTASSESTEMASDKLPTSQQSTDKESALLASSPADPGDQPEPEYLSTWKLVLLFIGLCLTTFCLSLDNTILATAIPRITDQFKSLDDVGWYASSYLLTTCATTLLFGKLYTFYSTKWIYLIALCIFEVGSLVCGVAPSSVALILGRSIAGIGAGGLFSGGVIILAQAIPLERRPIYTGMLTSMFGVASVAGPLMGGAFTDHVTWRWCFYINLPLGGVTCLFILLFFKAPKSVKDNCGLRDQLTQLDLPGTAVFVPAVVCVLLALQWGGTTYAWGNARIIALFVLFGVLGIVFVMIQVWQQERATVPPRVFKYRNVWAGTFFQAFLAGAFFINVYYMPIWFQAIKGVSATKSGIMSIPMILGVVVCSILAGILVTVLGHYGPFLVLSPVLVAVGCGLLTTLQVDSGHSAWIGFQALAGMGAGLGLQQPLMAVQASLPFVDVPTATALVMFSQSLGGSLFCSVGQNVFANQLRKNLMHDVPSVDAPKVISAGATMLRTVVSKEDLPAVLVAYSRAITEAFYVSVATAVISMVGACCVKWVSVKGKNVDAHAV
ncbi:major facilitator superfamily domain-containing protein [Aspergillus ambiguus]|uniref:MDR family MFS transporter n=1 Tax=Aspergillus ambiguus TaxID=176160 RepID=UPI003CCD1094